MPEPAAAQKALKGRRVSFAHTTRTGTRIISSHSGGILGPRLPCKLVTDLGQAESRHICSECLLATGEAQCGTA